MQNTFQFIKASHLYTQAQFCFFALINSADSYSNVIDKFHIKLNTNAKDGTYMSDLSLSNKM